MLDCITKHFSSMIYIFIKLDSVWWSKDAGGRDDEQTSAFNTYWLKEGKQTNTNTAKGTRTEKTTNMADHGHDSLVIIIAIENKQNSFMSK